jgi:hypothetical protein
MAIHMAMTSKLPATIYKYYEVKNFLPKVLNGEALNLELELAPFCHVYFAILRDIFGI